ncbi:hypothetical protein [Rhizobium ruizarguesonis]|uniref:hypothetical protein n=1 Tax=Rhizobium ruizarguesonis TaxID=2081791 RepID=UPI0013F156CF|nr:hypothetical protein [Rhizobium ruizarguesonis]WSH35657.1 hypothetical protein U8P70_10405 [Rhizobium ruizarguesonis]
MAETMFGQPWQRFVFAESFKVFTDVEGNTPVNVSQPQLAQRRRPVVQSKV